MKTNIIDIISSISADTDFKTDARLKEDLGIDSLRLVELMVAVEDKLDIRFELSDLDSGNLKTVQDVIDVTQKYIA